MSETVNNWKRGLLKVWLALSLLWAVGLTIWALTWTVDFSGELEAAPEILPVMIAILVLYVLPLGVIPCVVILFLGWITVTFFERFWAR